MFIRNGELVIISRVKTNEKRGGRSSFFKSLKFRLTVILVIVGILPGMIVGFGIVSSYKDRAVTIRERNVMTQCDILCNQIVSDDYLSNQDDLSLNNKLELLSDLYSGRVLIVDQDFKIVKDTFDQDEGKTMISEEILTCFKSGKSENYTSKGYIEMTLPITAINDSKHVLGVMMVSISMDEINASVSILEQKQTWIIGILSLVMLIIGYAIASVLVRPFNKVTNSMDNITDGFMDEDISVADYTETQRITDAFNSVMERVRVLDESRQEFVSNVSHELKTPLTSMKVLADSLNGQENVPIELYKEFMQDIGEEIDRENKIITDLLSLVKMDKKAADLNIDTVNINEMLELILKRLKPIAAKRDIRLLVDSYRPVIAEIDEVKLTLAFTNLVENAIKYNIEDGWVRVSLNADAQYFYVVVEDSGIGIPEDSLDHIFERFYRVDKSHSREIGGTGLGLAITKSSVMMHHGVVKVYSKEGEGTRFSVRIPLKHTQ